MSEKSINKWKKKIILTYHLTTSIIFFFSYKLCCKLGNLTIVNKYDFWITTYVHVLYYIFYKINNYMYSRFNISTGAFISLKTPSQVAEASYHIRICVCNIWFTDQCHSYKKFTLNSVQFQSSFFCALMHQSNRICSWWPIALYQRISLLQTNIWRSFLRGQFVPFKAWHIMRYQILSQWTSVQITSASSAKCL